MNAHRGATLGAALPDLRQVALAALARRLADSDRGRPEWAPLEAAREACRARWSADGPLGLARALIAAPSAGDVPLSRLGARLGLHPVEVLAVALAAAVEDDVRVGRALALLQAPAGGPRPSLGLIDAAFADCGEGRAPSTIIAGGAGERCGLLARLGLDAPLPEQGLRVPLPLALRLRGATAPWPGAEAPVALELPPRWHHEAAALARLIAAGGVLVIRGRDRHELRAAAAAVATALTMTPVVLSAEAAAQPGFAPWCVLAEAVPAVVLDPGPLDHAAVPAIAGHSGPLILLLPSDGAVDAPAAIVWRLEVPAAEERIALWAIALGDQAIAPAAAELRVGPARIRALAQAARAQARRDGREAVVAGDIARANAATDPGLGSLAVPVGDRVDDAALVLPPSARRELELLAARCRHRDDLHGQLGPTLTARGGCGVRALLVGPPGTGKSLAAAWLATRLGLPLHRVDLAAIGSKYIGETEKNLARLLAAAEATDIVLLFDEADALFAQRTDVRDASDRFANATTNYLLARIEVFRGVVLLTANSRTRFDAGFARRLDAVIEVTLPGAEERRALWRSHLGAAHRLGTAELNRLAAASDLAGGHIRNAVLTAALLARERGHAIGWDEAVTGLAGEYRKLGRALPAELASRG